MPECRTGSHLPSCLLLAHRYPYRGANLFRLLGQKRKWLTHARYDVIDRKLTSLGNMFYAQPAWCKPNPSPNHRLPAYHEDTEERPRLRLTRRRPRFPLLCHRGQEMRGHGFRLLLREQLEIELDLPNIRLNLRQHLNDFLLAKCALAQSAKPRHAGPSLLSKVSGRSRPRKIGGAGSLCIAASCCVRSTPTG